MGRRSEQKEERRLELLNVSLTLFVRKGYDGTKVRDIAAAAGVSAGLLFHYFPTKDDILKELLTLAESGIAEMAKGLETAADPLEGFREVARVVLADFAESSAKEIFLLVNQVKTYNPVPGLQAGLVDGTGMMERCIPVIERGQAMGQFKAGDPRALSLAFWGALQGIAELLSWYPDYPIPSADALADILRA